uniref:Mediator of RNA polymerase II transcription subunit 30 n=1 Tax=Hucho hucho TaxID=62062 RepID=A0A4W5NLX2_9TELE
MATPLLQKGLGLAGMLPQQQQYHLPLGSGSDKIQYTVIPFIVYIHNILFSLILWLSPICQLPNEVTQSQAVYQDCIGKLQEHLHQLALLFRNSDLQEELPEIGWCHMYPAVNQERQEVLEKVRQKNQEIKILDQMRNLLWDVKALLTRMT